MRLDDLPYAPGATLLGHLRAFDEDRLGTLRALGKVPASVVRARFLRRQVLLVTDASTTHELLVEKAKSFEKSPGIRVLLHDLAGEGLFTSEGDLWKRQRKLMSPLFHPAQLGTYALAMNVEANRAMDKLLDGQAVDLAREMTRVTMGVVASTLLGTDGLGSSEADALGDALTEALGFTGEMLSSPWISFQLTLVEAAERATHSRRGRVRSIARRAEAMLREPVLLPGARSPRLRRAFGFLDDTMQAMIDARRRKGVVRKDLLTKLLDARDPEGGGEGMSDKQVRDEAKTLFVAGHETTATALTWAFYLLARHPEALAKVQAEADAFDERGPTSYDPEKLAYTTQVFKEALRLYPPLVMLGRRSLEPVTIGGVALPAKTIVFASPYTLHYRADLYPQPDRFDPDRFLPEAEAARPKSAFLPFGVGPRVCIGNYFALMEGPIVLATWLRRARVEIDPTREVEADRFATLRPKGEVCAVIRKRS
jgi:cytochrome P450